MAPATSDVDGMANIFGVNAVLCKDRRDPVPVKAAEARDIECSARAVSRRPLCHCAHGAVLRSFDGSQPRRRPLASPPGPRQAWASARRRRRAHSERRRRHFLARPPSSSDSPSSSGMTTFSRGRSRAGARLVGVEPYAPPVEEWAARCRARVAAVNRCMCLLERCCRLLGQRQRRASSSTGQWRGVVATTTLLKPAYHLVRAA